MASILSAGGDKTMKAWDAESGTCLRTLEGHTDSVKGCAFSPDGRRIASAGLDGTVRLWDAESGVCLHILESHADGVFDCAFSPDGLG